MSTVQLSDIIDVTVFQDLPSINGVEKTALFNSGIVTRTPLLDTLASAAGKTAELPFWLDLDASGEPNYSSDDPTSKATPDKVSQEEQVARKAFVNKGWSASNLATEIASGKMAMEHIKARTDAYFAKQWQKRLIASANGVLADNVANDSSDMVHDIASESVAGQSATTKLNRSAILEAIFTLGDSFDDITAIGMHSMIAKQSAINDDIDYIKDSDGKVIASTYLDKELIIDDSLTVTAGATDGFKYTTILYGNNAFGYGEGSPVKPVALASNEDEGDGAGVDTLWVRNTWLLHPFGYKQSGTPSGHSFNLAELATAGVWTRVVDRKNVPLAFLVTN